MNTFQWIMIGIAAVLVVPIIWKKITSSIISEPEEIVGPRISDEQCEGLVSVVKRWDALKQCCVRQGMTKAVEELQKIFPLFVETDEREKEDE